MTSTELESHYDVVIIGAGSAGLGALAEVKKVTARLLLVESGPLGTMCARTGCMPSKALIEWARDPRGPENQSPLVRVRELRDYFVAAAATATERDAPHLVRARAEILGPDRVRVDDRTVSTRAIIVATGTRPRVPPEWVAWGPRAMTTETFFEQERLPDSCAVIGTGPVGLELGQAMARLGTRTSIFGRGPELGGLTDPLVQESARRLLGRDLDLYLGPAARPTGEGRVSAGETTVDVEQVLLSVGRVTNVEGLGLERLGVPLDDRGVPGFDPVTRRVGDLPVFLAGDLAGDRSVMHEAVFQGRTAGFHAVNRGPSPFKRYPEFLIAFTRPNIALVGERFGDLDANSIAIGQVDFANQGRARLMGEPGGLLRLYADAATGKIRGAEMICPAGEHLAHLLAFAIARGLTAAEMLELPFYHPTLEEGVRTALVQIQKQRTKAPNPSHGG